FFKGEFPCRIVGMAISFDLFVPGYWCCGGQAEPVVGGGPSLSFAFPKKRQFRFPDRPKYRSFTQRLPFVGCLRRAHRHRALKMAVSTWAKVCLAAACRGEVAP